MTASRIKWVMMSLLLSQPYCVTMYMRYDTFTLARYGGEEFILAMPDTCLETAR